MTLESFPLRPCPLCQSRDHRHEIASARPAEFYTLDELRPYWFGIEKEKYFFTYHRCHDCGLLYNRMFFDDAQLGQLYSAMPPNMDLLPSDAIAATQRGYFRAALAAGAIEGDYLEIGPDIGYIVAEAAQHGRFDRFWLFEPNQAVHDRLAEATGGRPAHLSTDMTDLSAVPDGTVGLAVMVHVLDHLLDPLAMLRSIRHKLRPGGTLLIVTHDESSLLRRVMGARWPAFCLQHPELYNPETIAHLLDRAGYADTRVSRSTNHFPIDFLGRQVAQAFGVRVTHLPLPKRSIGLRLGNMLTLTTAPSQATVDTGWEPLESAA